MTWIHRSSIRLSRSARIDSPFHFRSFQGWNYIFYSLKSTWLTQNGVILKVSKAPRSNRRVSATKNETKLYHLTGNFFYLFTSHSLFLSLFLSLSLLIIQSIILQGNELVGSLNYNSSVQFFTDIPAANSRVDLSKWMKKRLFFFCSSCFIKLTPRFLFLRVFINRRKIHLSSEWTQILLPLFKFKIPFQKNHIDPSNTFEKSLIINLEPKWPRIMN